MYFGVTAGEILVLIQFARIHKSAAVEYVTTAVMGIVSRNVAAIANAATQIGMGMP